MKTYRKFEPYFERSSPKTTEEIKATCEKISAVDSDYDIRSNGNHIWIEPEAKQYWSPLLHLKLVKSENETRIKGQFAENPFLWLTFLILKIVSIGIFILSGIAAWLKMNAAENFNIQLFVMFAMVSIWFGMYVISENYKRKGARQIAELHEFVDCIAA